MRTLSDRLIAARTRAGLTQLEAADQARLSRATVQNVETARYGEPKLTTLIALARVYGVDVGDLLPHGGEDGTRSAPAAPETEKAPVPTASRR